MNFELLFMIQRKGQGRCNQTETETRRKQNLLASIYAQISIIIIRRTPRRGYVCRRRLMPFNGRRLKKGGILQPCCERAGEGRVRAGGCHRYVDQDWLVRSVSCGFIMIIPSMSCSGAVIVLIHSIHERMALEHYHKEVVRGWYSSMRANDAKQHVPSVAGVYLLTYVILHIAYLSMHFYVSGTL